MHRDFQRPFRLADDEIELVLVRHGATAAHSDGAPADLLGGQSDPPLTDDGIWQAEAVAARLVAEPLAALFVTPLRRTAETAAPLVGATGLAPAVVPELREIHLGDWEGGEFQARVHGRDPLVARMFDEQRWDVLPNAEPMPAFAHRVARGLARIASAAGHGRIAAAFVHSAVIAEACRQATGSRALAFLGVENGALTRLVRTSDGTWLLRSFNETVHLGQA